MPRPSSPLDAKASTKCPSHSLENSRSPCDDTPLREPEEPGARSIANGNPLIRTHTVGDRRIGARHRCRTAQGNNPAPSSPLPRCSFASVTDPLASDNYRRVPSSIGADRRIASCQNPLHVFKNQMPENQCQTPLPNIPTITKRIDRPSQRQPPNSLPSDIRYPIYDMEPIGVEPTTS